MFLPLDGSFPENFFTWVAPTLLCSSSKISVPHIDPLPTISLATCQTISCSFDLDECLNQVRGTGWRVEEGPIGNLHTGIRMGYKGNFIYAKGDLSYQNNI
jgi:hypothetical protein